MPREDRDNALGGAAIPQSGRAAALPSSSDYLAGLLDEPPCIQANERVGPLRNCYGTFRVLSHREAWDAESSGLLLHAAGIRDYESRLAFEVQELKITQWRDQSDSPGTGRLTVPIRQSKACIRQSPLRPGVDRKNHGDLASNFLKGLTGRSKRRRIVHGRGAMKRGHAITRRRRRATAGVAETKS